MKTGLEVCKCCVNIYEDSEALSVNKEQYVFVELVTCVQNPEALMSCLF